MKGSLLVVGLVAAVTLAGCADADADNDVTGVVDKDSFQIASGKGAIAGLLVDDRFRPIQLTDDPQTEFQTTGFVLLQETGQRVQTTQNGEFTFVDLEPGSYTLRITADGHEATPQTAEVTEGVFNELTVVARRVASLNSLILTEEHSAFVPCSAGWWAPPGAPDAITFSCLDSSHESYRAGAFVNFTGVDNITYMVAEAKMQKVGNWEIQLRESGGNSGGTHMASRLITNGDYAKFILLQSDDEMYDSPDSRNPWNNSAPLEFINFYQGDVGGGVPVPGVPVPLPCVSDADLIPIIGGPNILGERCVNLQDDWETPGWGVSFGYKTKFIASAFVHEPTVDVESYALLAEDA